MGDVNPENKMKWKIATNKVLRNARARIDNAFFEIDIDMEDGDVIEFQRAVEIFPCGIVLVGKSFKDNHPALLDSHLRHHQLTRSWCVDLMSDKEFDLITTGELFRVVGGNEETYVKLDREISPRQRKILERRGFFPLKPDFSIY